ncbi:prenyltransferase [Paenibacillus sp. CAA11]|uniref:prenyltransferase n=1 Tax=Paenibacillus sp. CAA11 TaxID=1532905 RepID=UPI000D3D41F7|nr:prenyltransferase [Paenibacillus sp. CAA11]AWB45750.1 prenyltransferase [Paenibacillus sp. CAA11]
MNLLKQLTQASRMHFVPIMVICVVLGTLAAYLWNDEFHPWRFLLTLVGASAAHMFSTMYNDIWDYRSGADLAALASEEALSTDSGYLTRSVWKHSIFVTVTWSMLGIAAGCGLILYFLSGPGVLLLGLIGGLLASCYVAPPIRYGYWGRGTSEFAHVLSFGPLPVMGSYYVQTSHFDTRLLLLSLPVGLLTTLTFFNHHFLHWKTDKEVGKHTLVVMWGEKKSFRLSPLLLIMAYLSLAICIFCKVLPVYAIVALFSAWPLGRMYGAMRVSRSLQSYQSLMGLSLEATLRCGMIMIAALFIQSMAGH